MTPLCELFRLRLNLGSVIGGGGSEGKVPFFIVVFDFFLKYVVHYAHCNTLLY